MNNLEMPVASRASAIVQRSYPEAAVGGFTHVDWSIGLYSQIAALLKPTDYILDFGAGRGEQILDDPVPYRRNLINFRGRCAHVDGCDVSPVVMTNPFLDEAKQLQPGQPLPYEDNRFDIVVSRYVFEHIDDPEWLRRELLRVTKPGGWICGVTTNKWGYVAIGARMIPNAQHARMLKSIQPDCKEEDIFPTRYRMNTRSAIQKLFGNEAEVYTYTTSGEPAYYMGSRLIFGVLKLLHKFMPAMFQTAIVLFVRKKAYTLPEQSFSPKA